MTAETALATAAATAEQIADAWQKFNHLGRLLYQDGGSVTSKPQRAALLAERRRLREFLNTNGVATNAPQN